MKLIFFIFLVCWVGLNNSFVQNSNSGKVARDRFTDIKVFRNAKTQSIIKKQNLHMNAQTSNSNTLTITKAAMKAMAKLISTCGIGILAGQMGIINQDVLQTLSKLIFSIFQPCLLFVSVALTVSNRSNGVASLSMYILPMAAAVQILLGLLIGSILSIVLYGFAANSEMHRQLLACTTFANSGPLPLVFTDGLFQNHNDKLLLGKSMAYISLYLLGWSPLFWIFAPGILSERVASDNTAEQRVVRRRALIARVLSPPVMASLFGMIVGLFPPLRQVLVHSDGLLNPVFEAMRTLGGAYLPCVLLVLAGSMSPAPKVDLNLSTGPAVQQTKESNNAFAVQVLVIYLARFILMPVVSFGAIHCLINVFPDVKRMFYNDPMLLFILLLETCMPSAQNSTVVLQLMGQKNSAARLARVLMAIYVLGIPAMTYWLVKILHLTKL